MKLTIVTGPMFAGKTSYLMERVSNKKSDTTSIIATHSSDIRFTDESSTIINHNGTSLYHPILRIGSLQELPDIDSDAKVLLAIDEAQFFEDVVEYVRGMQKQGYAHLEIILCGLNGDFQQNAFGKEPHWISKLISIATDVVYLKAKCWKCEEPACFSIRKPESTDTKTKFLVGGSDVYTASCERHLPIH